MKVVSNEALTKLIQLVKSSFIKVDDIVQTQEVTLADVATSGDYDDLINKPTVDQTYSASSTNAQSGVAVANAIAPKQDTLVSGTNIKTVGGTSLLGSGNVAFPIVSSVSSSSTNADAVGAKLFYDTCGDIETLINAL